MGNVSNQMLIELIGKVKVMEAKKRAIVIILFFSAVIAFVLFVVFQNGGVTTNSGLRIGYVGNSTPHSWSGQYLELDGTMTKSLTPENEDLLVDIVTESGSIDIIIKDKSGEQLYRGTDLSTCSFKVGTKGKVSITVKGDKHRGSFSFN